MRKLHQIGKISRTHGHNGVLIFVSEHPVDHLLDSLTEIYLMIDGIAVPFPVERIEPYTNTSAQIKLEFVDNTEEASELRECAVYTDIPHLEQKKEEPEWIGYSVHDQVSGNIGKIRNIEDFNGNIVWQIVDDNNKETLLSIFPGLITKIDKHTKTLFVSAPEGYNLFEFSEDI